MSKTSEDQINDSAPGPVWDRQGDDFDAMTITPSIRCTGETCKLHIHIKAGAIEFLADSR